MNLKREDVKEDFARKDAEIEKLKAMNAELNTALNEVSAMLTDIQDGFIMSEHETEMLDVVYKAQEKAKGLSQ